MAGSAFPACLAITAFFFLVLISRWYSTPPSIDLKEYGRLKQEYNEMKQKLAEMEQKVKMAERKQKLAEMQREMDEMQQQPHQVTIPIAEVTAVAVAVAVAVAEPKPSARTIEAGAALGGFAVLVRRPGAGARPADSRLRPRRHADWLIK